MAISQPEQPDLSAYAATLLPPAEVWDILDISKHYATRQIVPYLPRLVVTRPDRPKPHIPRRSFPKDYVESLGDLMTRRADSAPRTAYDFAHSETAAGLILGAKAAFLEELRRREVVLTSGKPAIHRESLKDMLGLESLPTMQGKMNSAGLTRVYDSGKAYYIEDEILATFGWRDPRQTPPPQPQPRSRGGASR